MNGETELHYSHTSWRGGIGGTYAIRRQTAAALTIDGPRITLVNGHVEKWTDGQVGTFFNVDFIPGTGFLGEARIEYGTAGIAQRTVID